MSLIPYIFGDFLPTSDSVFGMGYYPSNELLGSFSVPLGYLRSRLSNLDEFERKMHIGEDGFEVKIDVKHFKPEEIKVKTVDNSIVIEAKHEEKKDSESSYISRQFVRRFDLPKEFKPEQVVSNLSSDGLLLIKCPKSETSEGVKVREIQIQPTGPARITQKKSEDKLDDKKEEVIQEKTEEKPTENTEEEN